MNLPKHPSPRDNRRIVTVVSPHHTWRMLLRGIVVCIVILVAHAVTHAQIARNTCGDGIRDDDEECDDGARNGSATSYCTTQCTRVLLQCIGGCGCFATGQPALDIVGQSDAERRTGIAGSLPNDGGYPPSKRGFSNPSGIAVSGKYRLLFVADTRNNRVVVYRLDAQGAVPSSSADYVIGQSTFTSQAAGTTKTTLRHPTNVLFDDARNRLFIADTDNNRVLVFDDVTSTALRQGIAPSHVLGQPNFTTSLMTSASSQSLAHPRGLAMDRRGRLYVADTDHNRVVVFETQNGLIDRQEAVVAFGQDNLTSGAAGSRLDQMRAPRAVAHDGNHTLAVADTGNNAVLLFDTDTFDNEHRNASQFINTFDVGDGGDITQRLAFPAGVAMNDDRLFIADQMNNRVVVFTRDRFDAADAILGQDNTLSNQPKTPPTASSLYYPAGVAFSSVFCSLFVADGADHRVLRFGDRSTCDASFQASSVAFGFPTCALDGSADDHETCTCEDRWCADNEYCSTSGVTSACVPLQSATSSSLRSITILPPSSASPDARACSDGTAPVCGGACPLVYGFNVLQCRAIDGACQCQSCPEATALVDGTWQYQQNILKGNFARPLERTTFERLRSDVGNNLTLRIEEHGGDKTLLNAIDVVSIDHLDGAQAYLDPQGSAWIVDDLSKAMLRHASDETHDTVEAPLRGDIRGVVVTATLKPQWIQALRNEAFGIAKVQCIPGVFALLDSLPQNVLDNVIRSIASLEIFVRRPDGWHALLERPLILERQEEAFLPIPSDADALRIQTPRGSYVIDDVTFVHDARPAQSVTITPSSVDALEVADDQRVTITNDHPLTLSFDLPGDTKTVTRYLRSNRYYLYAADESCALPSMRVDAIVGALTRALRSSF